MTERFLISFYADDFTGATDALESLATAGVKTVLFTAPPTPQQLARHPGIRAFGVAGTTRSMSPHQMQNTLRPAFTAMKDAQPSFVHYKVCSTFDSSPTIGSIGRAIDVGAEVFASKCVPVLAGAPALGRYCVFGNLFARSGAESEPFRLDRHPSMSQHPVTPMQESDLRVHLSKQTARRIGLLDVLRLEESIESAGRSLDAITLENDVVLIDLLYERQLSAVGSLIARGAASDRTAFVVGSSGVESALCAHWHKVGTIGGPASFDPVRNVGPILVICGSCSPVTAAQIKWAAANGMPDLCIDPRRMDVERECNEVVALIRGGQSVIVHSGANLGRVSAKDAVEIGPMLSSLLRNVLDRAPVARVLVAGGDTSGQIAQSLGIESMEMIGELTRGAPLVKVTTPNSPADGIEMTFKGGQIGPVDFFGIVRDGTADCRM